MLTVIIATRNGAARLTMALPAYCKLEMPSGGWKMIVVDNGSSDDTAAVIASYQARLPITYMFEPSLGKNVALNRGLEHSAGDLVVFSDDDAVPNADWLVRMRTLADTHPEFAIFAGCVAPRWMAPAPDWILRWVPMGPVFAVSDPKVTEGPTGSHNVFGPNMAVRADVFAAGYRFSDSIGPKGTNYAMGSETEFVRRMVRFGYKCWYSPSMIVEHIIEPEHLRGPWILRRAERFGRGQYRMDLSRHEYHRWFGVPRFLFRQVMTNTAATVWWALVMDRKRLFLARWDLHFSLGQIVEARKLRHEDAK